MLSNGYNSLTAGEDQSTGVTCTEQNIAFMGRSFTQCWLDGKLDDSVQYRIINKLDNRVVEMDTATGAAKMMTRDDNSAAQKWMIKGNADGVSGQFVNVGSNKVLSVRGMSDFTHNTPDNEGFFNIFATGGIEFSAGKSTAWDRGWHQKDGATVQVWSMHGGPNQKFKLEPVDLPM